MLELIYDFAGWISGPIVWSESEFERFRKLRTLHSMFINSSFDPLHAESVNVTHIHEDFDPKFN